MTIIKKIKQIQTLAWFTKLLGLAFMFSVASCGGSCKDDDAEVKVSITPDKAEYKIGEAAIKLKIKAGSAISKTEDLKFKVTGKHYKAKNYQGGDEADLGKQAVLKDLDGQTLKALLKVDSLKKDDEKEITVTIEPKLAQSAEFKIEILGKDDKSVGGPVDVKWSLA